MENFRRLTEKGKVINSVFDFVANRKVNSELGEPLVFDFGDEWIIYELSGVCVGFICFNENVLKYFFVHESLRGKGIGHKLMREYLKVAKYPIKLVATDNALNFYLRNGFEITKSYVKYHKLTKNEPI